MTSSQPTRNDIILALLFLNFSALSSAIYSNPIVGEKNKLGDLSTECLGPSDAKKEAIFLHGMDDLGKSSPDNQKAKEIISKIAVEHSLRVFAPRASETCKHFGRVQRCWKSQRNQSSADYTKQILSLAKGCLSSKTPDFFIGFSNGGYFTSRLFLECQKDFTSTHFIVVAAAGSLAQGRDSLKSCGKLSLLVGSDDKLTLPDAKSFFSKVLSRGADVKFVSPKGGHKLFDKELREALSLN